MSHGIGYGRESGGWGRVRSLGILAICLFPLEFDNPASKKKV
jgi:hypothetical protein